MGDKSTGGLANATLDKRKNRSLFATWAIVGLWHGANWTFMLWGLTHAVLIALSRLILPLTRDLPELVRTLGGMAVTIPLVMLAWIPLRALSLEICNVGGFINPSAYGFLGLRENIYPITAIITIGILLAYLVKSKLLPTLEKLSLTLIAAKTLVFSIVIPLVVIFFRPISQFIYFQF